jgi:hypothetical protein
VAEGVRRRCRGVTGHDTEKRMNQSPPYWTVSHCSGCVLSTSDEHQRHQMILFKLSTSEAARKLCSTNDTVLPTL